MRTAIAAFGIFFACTAGAEAGCRLEGSYPGRIAGGKTVNRTLYLFPKSAQINVVADSESDRLTMKVLRPSGATGCKTRGPGAMLDCALTVKSKGNHTVRIHNPLRRVVTYTMQCWNAGE